MPIDKIKILMLSAGVITGAFRMMLDIIRHIDTDRFRIYVAYKPELGKWGKHEIDSIRITGSQIIPLQGKWLFDLRGYIDLWGILRKEKIDILHCWDELGIPAKIIGKLAGVKIVQEFASAPPILTRDMSPIVYFANKITSLLDDGFVACSNEVLKEYKNTKPVFFNNKILSVVHNCVEVPDFNESKSNLIGLRKQYGLKDQELVLTNIGHFNRQKAQSDLLHSFKIVVEKMSNVRLILVGWGPLEKDLKNQTKALGLENRVIFTGRLNRSQVFEVLSITDLFVLSSHWEGFGIVTAEAMALGKPVVATNTDGSREVIRNGETGVIVPINEPETMAAAIVNLLENSELMLQMGQRGLKRVKKYFNCKKYIQGYEDFYQKVFITQ